MCDVCLDIWMCGQPKCYSNTNCPGLKKIKFYKSALVSDEEAIDHLRYKIVWCCFLICEEMHSSKPSITRCIDSRFVQQQARERREAQSRKDAKVFQDEGEWADWGSYCQNVRWGLLSSGGRATAPHSDCEWALREVRQKHDLQPEQAHVPRVQAKEAVHNSFIHIMQGKSFFMMW